MKLNVLALFVPAILFFGLVSINCGKETPPQPPPGQNRRVPTVQQPPKTVITENKPKLAESFPESAYIELVANADFLYEKHEGNRKKINEEMLKIANKFNYKIKNPDDIDELMVGLSKQLDEIKNSDPENGPQYEEALNDLVQKRLAILRESEEPEGVHTPNK